MWRKKKFQYSGHVIGSILLYLLEGAKQACPLLRTGDSLGQLRAKSSLPLANPCCGTTRTQQTPETCLDKHARRSSTGDPEGVVRWTMPRNQGQESGGHSLVLHQGLCGLRLVTHPSWAYFPDYEMKRMTLK